MKRLGLIEDDTCPKCGGGGGPTSSSSRLHLGADPPATCDECEGPIDFTGRGLARTWKWIRFVDQPEHAPDTSESTPSSSA
ncbi:MAG: hypothetical protein KDC14_05380 [Planctomycetes bacterium]|nr:hypothetical protein [Planctomycetota bacterium]